MGKKHSPCHIKPSLDNMVTQKLPIAYAGMWISNGILWDAQYGPTNAIVVMSCVLGDELFFELLWMYGLLLLTISP